MAHERLRNAAFPLSEVVADLADLFQKELRLARAEISAKLSTRLHAGIWMSVAGVLALVAALEQLRSRLADRSREEEP